VQRFTQEIKHFASRGIRYFWIADDVISAADLNLISSAIIKNKLDIFFGLTTRPDKGFSSLVLKNIYRSGGRLVAWGVESTSQRILDLMHKGTKIREISCIIRESARAGLHNHLCIICGFPTQTKQEILQDIEFLRKNRKHLGSLSMHDFVLGRDSYLFNNPEQFGIKRVKERVVCRLKKKLLKSYTLSFETNNSLNWKVIRKKQAELFRDLWQNYPSELISYSYSHVLIQISQKR